MKIDEYQKLAARTTNLNASIKERLALAGLGLGGESGEVQDIIKKSLGHGHELDKDEIIGELGDTMWYIAEVCTILGLPLSYVLGYNIDKLERRYPEGFSEERSRNRSDS